MVGVCIICHLRLLKSIIICLIMFSASIPNGFEATNVVILVKLHYYESALGQKHKSFL